jgi:hypothetical protein
MTEKQALKSNSALDRIIRTVTAILLGRWFSISVGFAILYLGILQLEEYRVTIGFPVEPQPQIGAIYSWTSHTDHKKHYLSAAAHRYLFDLAAGLIVYWFAICYASWIRIGKSAPYRWSRSSYFGPDPKRGRQTAFIVVIGVIVSTLLASGSLSPVVYGTVPN